MQGNISTNAGGTNVLRYGNARDLVLGLEVVLPSGEIWEYGEKGSSSISGTAVDFAAVVTQTRAVADTALEIEGDVASTWMTNAQCFAGPPEPPPAKGSRVQKALTASTTL